MYVNNPKTITSAARKLVALLFLVTIALVPFFIVTSSSRFGGIWVAGYVTGILTAPFVAFGVIGAINTLDDREPFIGIVAFCLILIVISLAVALWSLFGSPPQL